MRGSRRTRTPAPRFALARQTSFLSFCRPPNIPVTVSELASAAVAASVPAPSVFSAMPAGRARDAATLGVIVHGVIAVVVSARGKVLRGSHSHVRCALATAQGAELREPAIQPDQPKETLDEDSRPSQRHAEQHLHRKARLDRGIAVRCPQICRRFAPLL